MYPRWDISSSPFELISLQGIVNAPEVLIDLGFREPLSAIVGGPIPSSTPCLYSRQKRGDHWDGVSGRVVTLHDKASTAALLLPLQLYRLSASGSCSVNPSSCRILCSRNVAHKRYELPNVKRNVPCAQTPRLHVRRPSKGSHPLLCVTTLTHAYSAIAFIATWRLAVVIECTRHLSNATCPFVQQLYPYASIVQFIYYKFRLGLNAHRLLDANKFPVLCKVSIGSGSRSFGQSTLATLASNRFGDIVRMNAHLLPFAIEILNVGSRNSRMYVAPVRLVTLTSLC